MIPFSVWGATALGLVIEGIQYLNTNTEREGNVCFPDQKEWKLRGHSWFVDAVSRD